MIWSVCCAAMDGGEREYPARVRPDGAGLQPPVLGAQRRSREDQSPSAAAGEEREDSGHHPGELPEGEGFLQTQSQLWGSVRCELLHAV